MALGQRAGRLGFEMKSESHTPPLFDRSRLAEKPGNDRRDTTGSRLQATERRSVSPPIPDFILDLASPHRSNKSSPSTTTHSNNNAMSPRPPFEDRRSMAPKPESDGSASASRDVPHPRDVPDRRHVPHRRLVPLQPDADTQSGKPWTHIDVTGTSMGWVRPLEDEGPLYLDNIRYERELSQERAQHEQEKNIIGRTDRLPLRADSKTSTPGKKVCLHYTVSKDCSKPQDTRREKHLLAMVLSGDGSEGPPRTIAPVHRTAPAEKRDYRPLMALPRLWRRLSPPSRRKKPVIKFIRDKVA